MGVCMVEGGVCGCGCVGGSCVWVCVWWRVVCVVVGVLEGRVCGCVYGGGWCVWVRKSRCFDKIRTMDTHINRHSII